MSAPGVCGREASRAGFVAELVAWLNRRFAPAVEITATTPLFAGGMINSIRVLELIAWTERATGRQIPDAAIRMDNFHSPERIAEVFAAGETRAEP
jgi:acyl carrier protein